MNPIASLFGSLKALAGREDWTDHFDLSRAALQASFMALALSLPAFYLMAHAVQIERAARFGEDAACLLYTSPSPRDATLSRMPSSA